METQAETQSGPRKDFVPALLAMVAIFGFLGVLGLLMFAELKDNIREPFLIMVGILGTIVTQVFSFYFGSSKGSESKNDTISAMIGGEK